MRNLKATDFQLSDNGQAREIRYFWQESELPLTVALVADVSGSQAGFVKSHRDSIAQFLKQVIGPRDRAMIVEVDRQARLISGLTRSLNDLNREVKESARAKARRRRCWDPPAGTRHSLTVAEAPRCGTGFTTPPKR